MRPPQVRNRFHLRSLQPLPDHRTLTILKTPRTLRIQTAQMDLMVPMARVIHRGHKIQLVLPSPPPHRSLHQVRPQALKTSLPPTRLHLPLNPLLLAPKTRHLLRHLLGYHLLPLVPRTATAEVLFRGPTIAQPGRRQQQTTKEGVVPSLSPILPPVATDDAARLRVLRSSKFRVRAAQHFRARLLPPSHVHLLDPPLARHLP